MKKREEVEWKSKRDWEIKQSKRVGKKLKWEVDWQSDERKY